MTTQREKEARLDYQAKFNALDSLWITECNALGVSLQNEMIDTAADLRTQMLRRSEAQRRLKVYQDLVTDLKSGLILEGKADGPNDGVRSAKLAKALNDMGEYQHNLSVIAVQQQIIDEASAEIDFYTNKLAALKAESRRITAMLTALGSE